MALRAAGLLCGVIKTEAAGALDIVVPSVSERRVRADNDLLAASGQLDRRELLLVVLFERGAELRHQAGVGHGQRLDICNDIGELFSYLLVSSLLRYPVCRAKGEDCLGNRRSVKGLCSAGGGIGWGHIDIPRPEARPPRKTQPSKGLTW